MKKVYIVIGSEDGVIGVFSSKSKARQRAISYVKTGLEDLLDPAILSDATKWTEYFYSTNTSASAEIMIQDLL